MGTHLYDGMRLAPDVDPFTLPALIEEILGPIRDRLDADLLLHRAVAAHDRVALGLPLETGPVSHVRPLDQASEDYRREQDALAGARDDIRRDPHGFALYVGRERRTRRLLVYPASRLRAYREALASRPEFEPYWYASDLAPAGVSAAEWRQRASDWDDVVDHELGDKALRFDLRTEPAGSALHALLFGNGPARTVLAERLEFLTVGSLSPRARAGRIGRDVLAPMVHGRRGARTTVSPPLIEHVLPLLPDLSIDTLTGKVIAGDHAESIRTLAATWLEEDIAAPRVDYRALITPGVYRHRPAKARSDIYLVLDSLKHPGRRFALRWTGAGFVRHKGVAYVLRPEGRLTQEEAERFARTVARNGSAGDWEVMARALRAE